MREMRLCAIIYADYFSQLASVTAVGYLYGRAF